MKSHGNPFNSDPLSTLMYFVSQAVTQIHRAESWWRHQMETSSVLLAICAGNSPVPGEYPAQRPVTRSFDVFFDLRPNKLLSKQSWGWWSETPSRSLWRHRNDPTHSALYNNWFYTWYFFLLSGFIFFPNLFSNENHLRYHVVYVAKKILWKSRRVSKVFLGWSCAVVLHVYRTISSKVVCRSFNYSWDYYRW